MKAVDQAGGAGKGHPAPAAAGQQPGGDDDQQTRLARTQRRQIAHLHHLRAIDRPAERHRYQGLHRLGQIAFEKQRLVQRGADPHRRLQHAFGIAQGEQQRQEVADASAVLQGETRADEGFGRLPAGCLARLQAGQQRSAAVGQGKAVRGLPSHVEHRDLSGGIRGAVLAVKLKAI